MRDGPEGDADTLSVEALVDLLGDLQREAARDDVPNNLKTLARSGVEHVSALLEAVRAGNQVLIQEILLGTLRADGRRRPDGIRQVLPHWARGRAVLNDLAGIVIVDESQDPATVTVHWEQVPRKLRPAAASLASELVDAYQPRPKGGRPRKAPENIPASKLGDPDTGDLPA